MSKGAKRDAASAPAEASGTELDVDAAPAANPPAKDPHPEVEPVWRVRPHGRLKFHGRMFEPGEAVPLSRDEAKALADVVMTTALD